MSYQIATSYVNVTPVEEIEWPVFEPAAMMVERWHDNFRFENQKFGALLDTKELERIQQPAFKFDDSGLNIFDDYLPLFMICSQEGNLEALNDAIISYRGSLFKLAETLDWFDEDYKAAAIKATKDLQPVMGSEVNA